MVSIIVVIIVGLLLLVSGILLLYSPGKISPYVDKNNNVLQGSLAEKVFIPIGGIQQGMFIRSKNLNNPVLLYVHGGPAFPNYFLIEKYNPGLEDYFTVCYWEQRGGGLSYSNEVTKESMNFDQLASDAMEVTNYLRKRFGKEKIFMMAHSGGTPIALLAAFRNPEWYYAYIAMAQITNQAESEKVAYTYMVNEYTRAGKQKRISALKRYQILEPGANILPYYSSTIRDRYMHESGIGTMHHMKSIFREIFLPVWTCRAYTLKEKINIWKSKFFFLPETNIYHELLSTDFTKIVQKLEVPVYFFSGQYDLTVNVNLSRSYLSDLEAPVKGFYTFHHSAHSPLYEQPDSIRKIIEFDVLNLQNNLAD